MLTDHEILLGIALPFAVSLLVGLVGWWRGWPSAMPLAAGAGFGAAYACLGRPRLPPADGVDWLFWLAIPATLLGMAVAGGRVGRLLSLLGGAWAGLVAWAVLRPIAHGQAGMLFASGAGLAAVGVAQVATVSWAADRLGNRWAAMAMTIALGAAGIVVLSSNMRTSGIYGLAAGAAMGPMAWFASGRSAVAGGLAVVMATVLAGLLVGGRFYADPGVSWVNFAVLCVAPALLAVGALVPARRRWVRGAVAVALVGGAVAAVAIPAAVAAKRDAEAGPFGGAP